MISIRRSSERGYVDHGWLQSYHTFSFASYHDRNHMRFRSLRVMNEDHIAPGQGFGTHAHDNMEIVTYVLAGELEHKDSMGNGEVLRPGEFQRISAGTGITHSEFNPSADASTHLYQIWLLPDQQGIQPGYEQKAFDDAGRQNQLQLVASPDQAEGSLLIHQDARICLSNLSVDGELTYRIPSDRYVWLQVLRGEISAGGEELQAGDALSASSEANEIRLASSAGAELMLFDLA